MQLNYGVKSLSMDWTITSIQNSTNKMQEYSDEVITITMAQINTWPSPVTSTQQ